MKTKVISKQAFGSIKPGDSIATFDSPIFAAGHYWVQRGWAYVETQ